MDPGSKLDPYSEYESGSRQVNACRIIGGKRCEIEEINPPVRDFLTILKMCFLKKIAFLKSFVFQNDNITLDPYSMYLDPQNWYSHTPCQSSDKLFRSWIYPSLPSTPGDQGCLSDRQQLLLVPSLEPVQHPARLRLLRAPSHQPRQVWLPAIEHLLFRHPPTTPAHWFLLVHSAPSLTGFPLLPLKFIIILFHAEAGWNWGRLYSVLCDLCPTVLLLPCVARAKQTTRYRKLAGVSRADISENVLLKNASQNMKNLYHSFFSTSYSQGGRSRPFFSFPATAPGKFFTNKQIVYPL